jgi:1,2-diacylglycerol 3-alpha-glucosyltransferase
MKIIHFCLSSFFNDGFLYQENELVREHLRSGHEVLVVASTEEFDSNGYITYTKPRNYVGDEGAQVIRLPYRRWLPSPVAKKIRTYPSVSRILEKYKPDVVVFHGSTSWELLTVSRYVRRNPCVDFFIDSHADAINSGQSWISLEILHRRFYAAILKKAMRNSGPLLCVSQTVVDFARDVYRIPASQLEFFPLGGRVPNSDEYTNLRASMRARLGISADKILLVQSGKQNRLKKLPEALKAFAKNQNERLRLVVAGVLQDDVRQECEALIAADHRVSFVGWMNADELTALLCAADVYLQPGSQSATMQQALCCGCPVILDDIAAHEFYATGSGWLTSNEFDLLKIFEILCHDKIEIYRMAAFDFSKKYLDYKVLGARLAMSKN